MLGFVGSGNMARALARGWGDPVLATDSGSGRAKRMVAELGGEALRSNADLAQRADSIVLCHKPYQIEEVAAETAPHAHHVISVLGGIGLDRLRAAYPQATVVRAMPNTPVEVRQGVTVLAESEGAEEARVLFDRLGHVFVVPERLLDAATATTGVAPAYVARRNRAIWTTRLALDRVFYIAYNDAEAGTATTALRTLAAAKRKRERYAFTETVSSPILTNCASPATSS